MKNLKIRSKLTLGFAIVVIMLIACVFISLFNLKLIGGSVREYYNGVAVVKDNTGLIRKDFEAVQKYTFRTISTEDVEISKESADKARAAMERLEDEFAVVKEKFKGDKQLVIDLEEDLGELKTHNETVLTLAEQNLNREASEYMEANIVPLILASNEYLDSIADFANNRGDNMLKEISRSETSTSMLLLLFGIASVIASFVLGTIIVRGVVKPLNEIKDAAFQMSRGNLKTTVEYESKDEIGQVAQALRNTIMTLDSYISDISRGMAQMEKGNLRIQPSVEFKGDFVQLAKSIMGVVQSFNITLHEINGVAEQVGSGSQQMASGAQELSTGAAQQASSVEELAATINIISGRIAKNAENAERATERVNSVGDEIDASNEKMQNMIGAMSEISSNSEDIRKIIKTIEDIAFQTNILALNAAVEAARAGEAGKGFAVVADEVRNLASKSAEASKNTSALIENSIRAVENGKVIADDTAKALANVVDGAKSIIEIMEEISEDSKGQAEAAEQVTSGIDQISAVVQTNSAASEESAASSQELSAQAQVLNELVSRFQLDDKQDQGGFARRQERTETLELKDQRVRNQSLGQYDQPRIAFSGGKY